MNIFRGSRGTSLGKAEKLIGGAAIAVALALALSVAICMIGTQIANAYPAGWSLQQRVASTDVAQCDITAWRNHVWAARRKSDGSIWVRHSADYGATWSAFKNIENGAFSTSAPVIVVGGSGTNPTVRIYVIYGSNREGGGYLQTWIARSDDLGENWQNTGERWHSSGTGNKTAHAACRYPVSHIVEFAFVAPDAESNKKEVYTGEIQTEGQVGVRSNPLSKDDGIESSHPVIACDGYANAMVVWQDEAGGSYERSHLMYAHTTDKGTSWTKGSIPYSSDYEQMYPSMTWDQNPVLACMGKNVKSGVHHIGRYTFYTTVNRWLPGEVGESINALTADIASIPAIGGRHDEDIYYRNASLRLTRGCSSPIGDILGNEAILGGTNKIAVTSSDSQNDSSIDYIAATTSEGKLYLRRKDPVKPSVEITCPKFEGSSPIYLNSNFSLKCENACDDFCADGVDITTNVEYHKGLEKVSYYYSLDDATWDLVPSDGFPVSCLPPYEVEVDTSQLNGKGLRIKSVAVDSAGNKSEYVTPRIFVDLDAPVTSLHVRGTEGSDGFFRSDASLSFDVEDMANSRTEYRIEPESGNTNTNWTFYKSPFALREGSWKVSYRSIDRAGNVESTKSQVIRVDLDAPVTSLRVRGTKGFDGFFRSDASLSFDVEDMANSRTEYRIKPESGNTNGNWTLYSAPFALREGSWKVFYRSIDKAGNVESVKSRVVRVDTKSPNAMIDKPEKDSIQFGFNSEDSCIVSGRGSDQNGLKSGTLYIDGEELQRNGGEEFRYAWDLSHVEEGQHDIQWVVEDRAGNVGRAGKNVVVGNVARDWYFAEGNTLPEFDEYICILNPGDKPAKVLLSFMLEDGSMINAERHMAPSQRDTVRVKDIVPEGHDVSAKVHCSEQAIICERPMYFMYRNRWKGGHNVMGTNVLQKEWYFSEGTTRKNPVDGEFEPWLCLMNPSFEQSASVEVCYMLSSGQNIVKRYGVSPHSRKTIEIENDIGINQDVATKVSSDLPLAAELPMYFNYHGFAVDGSNVAGATSPSKTWYFAEGATHPGFEEWLTIQNPSNQRATCEITYMTGAGAQVKVEEIVPPMSRATVDVLAQVGDNQDVSAKVTSDVPIIAARPMYFLYGLQGWSGGEASLGNPAPSTKYFLAEGTCRTGFDTWYTLQNPSDTEQCDVEIKYVFPDGSSKKGGYRINPHSRLTIFVNEVVGKGTDVSACISASSKVVVERPIYFNYGGTITGGHNVLGFGTD